jgi:hypothetical protein
MAEVTREALALALSRMYVTVGSPRICDPDREVPGGSAQGLPLYPDSLASMLLADIAGQATDSAPEGL